MSTGRLDPQRKSLQRPKWRSNFFSHIVILAGLVNLVQEPKLKPEQKSYWCNISRTCEEAVVKWSRSTNRMYLDLKYSTHPNLRYYQTPFQKILNRLKSICRIRLTIHAKGNFRRKTIVCVLISRYNQSCFQGLFTITSLLLLDLEVQWHLKS